MLKKKLLLFDFLKFFFENFFVKNWRIFFSLIFFLYYWPAIILEIQKSCIYSIERNTPILICIFLPFQNSLFSQCKKWKIEKIEFICAYCVHTQKNLWDISLMLCCSPKNFSWFFETFLVLKILAKKNIFRKKGSTTEISGGKKMKNGRFSPIGRNMDPIFGGPFLGIRGGFCKKN